MFIRLSTAVPEVDDFNYIVINPINKLIQVLHNNASILHWSISKKRLNRAKVWIVAQKLHYAMDFIPKIHSFFHTKLFLNISCCTKNFLLGFIFNFNSHTVS